MSSHNNDNDLHVSISCDTQASDSFINSNHISDSDIVCTETSPVKETLDLHKNFVHNISCDKVESDWKKYDSEFSDLLLLIQIEMNADKITAIQAAVKACFI